MPFKMQPILAILEAGELIYSHSIKPLKVLLVKMLGSFYMIKKRCYPYLFYRQLYWVGVTILLKCPKPNKTLRQPQIQNQLPSDIVIGRAGWLGKWLLKRLVKEAGLNVEFKWFDYSASLRPFRQISSTLCWSPMAITW